MKKTNLNDIKQINSLLNQLKASKWLRVNVKGLLAQSHLLGFHSNQIINALKIAIEFKVGLRNIGCLAPMQSGKSGTIYILVNYVLPGLGLLKEMENVLFVTSIRDLSLLEQNKATFGAPYYDFVSKRKHHSRLLVYKIDKFFQKPNPYMIVEEANIKIIIRDEDHHGSRKESVFDIGFFKKLRVKLPNIPLLAVSATPFGILDAKDKGNPVQIVVGERPKSYFGITEMLKGNFIDDLPEDFSVIEECKGKSGKCSVKLAKVVEDYTSHLLKFKTGIGIVRVSNTEAAKALRTIVKEKYKSELDCLLIGSVKGCDHKIDEGISKLERLVYHEKKRVFLIIVQALSAGKDFKDLKNQIRFIIESRDSQLANVAQGLPGRLCGYHTNRDFKIMASISILRNYSKFELDYKVFFDHNWRKAMLSYGVAGLGSHESLYEEVEHKKVVSIERMVDIPLKVLKTDAGRRKLNMIDQESYDNLLASFDKKNFGNKLRIKDKSGKTTARFASSYNPKSNRVYKLWKSIDKKGYKNLDFGSVMFMKKRYKYGLLVSNCPNKDIKFVGVRLIEAGRKKMLTHKISVNSKSMHNPQDN